MGLVSYAAALAVLVAPASASDVYMHQGRIAREIYQEHQDISVSLAWMPCGDLNAMYFPDSHEVVICTEVSDTPAVAGFFVAHEMGHAVLMQEIGDDTEDGADTFATIWLLEHGYESDVGDAVGWMMEQDQGRHNDEHPSWRWREWNAICLTSGFNDDGNKMCRAYYLGRRAALFGRLKIDRIPNEE